MSYNLIAIRIDGTDASPLIQTLDKDGGAYCIVKELEDSNPHFHAVLHSTRKLPAVRQAIKRAYPSANGNGAYSVTMVRDLSKYQRYMMKGPSSEQMPHVVAANGINYASGSWQEEQHDAYWVEADEIKRKRSKANIVDSVTSYCKEQKYSWTNREAIAQAYLRELVARNKPINKFAAKSAVNLIQVYLCPDDTAIEELARDV